MADKEKKEAETAKETIKEEVFEVVKPYTIKREVTVDKLYKKGSTIYLPDGKIKDSLISNKFI